MNDPNRMIGGLCQDCNRSQCSCPTKSVKNYTKISFDSKFLQYQVCTLFIPALSSTYGPLTSTGFTYSQYWALDGQTVPPNAVLLRAFASVPSTPSNSLIFDGNEDAGTYFQVSLNNCSRFHLIFPSVNIISAAINNPLLSTSNPPVLTAAITILYILT